MHAIIRWTFPLVLLLGQSGGAKPINPALAEYAGQGIGEFGQISAERKAQLQKIADYLREYRHANRPSRLVFICTHNSRRSHLAQIWAATAAAYFGVTHVEVYSGGTEATAFHPRAVAALRRAGFEIEKPAAAANPHYLVRFGPDAAPLECFSKEYRQPPNPRAGFCAVMTCSQADRDCPTVVGAAVRIAIPYEDPKSSDGTPQESACYDERCAQIAREMFYVFSRARD